MFNFNASDWCWRLQDKRVWSTKKGAFVTEEYAQEWLNLNGLLTIPISPPDKLGASNEAGLLEALNFYGLPLGELETDEEKYYAERAAVDAKYSAPWNGLTGGILTVLQMTMLAAQCEVPQNPEKIASIGTEYQAELAAMRAELQAIDEKYGV